MTHGCPDVLDWLLAGDPAIRWQVMRDFLHEDRGVCQSEREKVARDGWGRRLLALQAADGLWGGSLYNGKWTSTTYSLYLLKLLGLAPYHPQALLGCSRLMEGGLYEGREIRFSRRQEASDLGVTALVLSLSSYFGLSTDELTPLAEHLLARQRPDGCWWPNDSPASHGYEFETTRLVLEALMQFQRASGTHGESIAAGTARGLRFLFRNELGFESGRLGKPGWSSFSFPPYWFYDCLTVLDYLRDLQADRDPGACRAVDLVRIRRRPDGRWGLGAKHAGRTFFDMEVAGEASRWNTLRAMRVLDWWGGDPIATVGPYDPGPEPAD